MLHSDQAAEFESARAGAIYVGVLIYTQFIRTSINKTAKTCSQSGKVIYCNP